MPNVPWFQVLEGVGFRVLEGLGFRQVAWARLGQAVEIRLQTAGIEFLDTLRREALGAPRELARALQLPRTPWPLWWVPVLSLSPTWKAGGRELD